jgi:hypothetical protein
LVSVSAARQEAAVVILTRQSALDFLGEENDKGKKTRTLDLLSRLGVATLIAARHGKPLPDDLAPLVDQLEAAFDVGTHRLTHLDQPFPSTNETSEGFSCRYGRS